MMRSIVFLAAAFAVSTTPVYGQSAKPGGADKLGWKLTLQSWSINYGPGPKTTFESIDVAKKLGVHYLEVYPGQEIGTPDKGKFGPEMTEEQIKAVLERAKANDVTIIDTGVIGIPDKEPAARKLFDWAKKMGITTIVSEPDPSALPMIDKVAGEYGIKVAIHDHPKPSRYWDPEYTYGLMRDLKNVGYCADVGHWKRSGLEPADVLTKHGEKVFSSHFKDLVANKDGKNMHDVVWGEGNSKAAEMLAVLKAKRFQGPIAIEFETKWELPTLQKCVDFFNQQADKLAAE
jgi:sugar phosphate isomerase/epimerase